MSVIIAAAQIEKKIGALVDQAQALVDMTEVRQANAEKASKRIHEQWMKVSESVNAYFSKRITAAYKHMEDIDVELDYVTVFRDNLVRRFSPLSSYMD